VQVRVEQAENRAREDRVTVDRLTEQQRAQDTLAGQRHTELLQALHAMDSRLSRIEDRIPARRDLAMPAPARVDEVTKVR
jgi:hypothetical protein